MGQQLAMHLPSGPAHPRADGEEAYTTERPATSKTFDEQLLVTELVIAAAQGSPHRRAVVTEEESLTYGDLEHRANRLAHYLLSRGARPDRPIILCLPRSPSFVVSALAVLRTGSPYLPLDPTWPDDRLRFVKNDSGAPLVITQGGVAPEISSDPCQIVNLQADAEAISHGPASDLLPRSNAQGLAYIIYTSGSTGRPKGVEVTHESLLNLVRWHQRAFRVSTADRATLVASPGFDASVWEIWPYICAGATLHIPGDCLRNDAEHLRDWLVAQGITITFVPTPLAERMITINWPTSTALRLMLTGADTLHHYPPAGLPFNLINNYGPTECTVVTTSGVVPPGGPQDSVPSIGKPIDNMQVFILDEHLNQLPNGAAGELCVSGRGLARGYVNGPELTAEKFIPNPFSTEPGSRLYRTGDVARYLPDGQIEFLGRTDDQIKIRGYRIEPGEIVATLAQHPSIRASYVMARDNGRAEKDLVAYIVPSKDSRPRLEELRSFLLRHLPEYMVPGVIVSLGSLPLSSSGKVDRRELPPPSESNVLRSESYVSPQTAVQERVTSIVVYLLGLQEIGVNDNFFMLGGNSLLAAQLIARVAEAFDVEIPLGTLFGAPTVAQLSAAIERLLTCPSAERNKDEAQQRRNCSTA
jgi:amino acid adenylation domain-containing protein